MGIFLEKSLCIHAVNKLSKYMSESNSGQFHGFEIVPDLVITFANVYPGPAV